MQPVEQLIEPVHLIEGIIEEKGDIRHAADVSADAGHKGLLEAGEVLIQFQQYALFVVGIVNTEVYFSQVKIRSYFHLSNGHKRFSSIDVASFILQHYTKIPLDQFGYL